MEGHDILTNKGDLPIQSLINDLKRSPQIVITTPGSILTFINK